MIEMAINEVERKKKEILRGCNLREVAESINEETLDRNIRIIYNLVRNIGDALCAADLDVSFKKEKIFYTLAFLFRFDNHKPNASFILSMEYNEKHEMTSLALESIPRGLYEGVCESIYDCE